MTVTPFRHRWLVLVAALALCEGIGVAAYYHHLDLTLSHYDARGHLVVARRIFDSITPGWQQIGAVWLPLPHLLNALPVQIDWFYRTGLSAVAISVLAHTVAVASLAWIADSLTGSPAAVVASVVTFAANPNVLYLQATPMTEPLLLGTILLGVALLLEWVARLRDSAVLSGDPETNADVLRGSFGDAVGRHAGAQAAVIPARHLSRTHPPTRAGAVAAAFSMACLTRYEAWPVTFVALAAALWIVLREKSGRASALTALRRVAFWPAASVAAFLLFSRVVVGEWFVSSGFFVPENQAWGRPLAALAEVIWGIRALSGNVVLLMAAVGLTLLVLAALSQRVRASGLIPIALAATAALPLAAFFDGHPFRIRYMVPLVAVEAVGVGVSASVLARVFASARIGSWRAILPPIGASDQGARSPLLPQLAAAVLVSVGALYDLHPLDTQAPMVVEAEWDRPNFAARQHVTDCLRAGYRGDTVMASMGSLGHYMQQAALSGFALRDFLHEGNGDIWLAAMESPRPYAGWVLVEEKAEGGDMLALAARRDPQFLAGFTRVCEGAGMALYRRNQ